MMTQQPASSGFMRLLTRGSLVKQILIGLILGILLALVSKPHAANRHCGSHAWVADEHRRKPNPRAD